MKFISKTLRLLPLFFLVLGLSNCSDDDNDSPQVTTVVDVALANNLTSLAAALTATDLVTTLQGSGPFTVFAPTNEAFTTFLATANIDLDNLTTAEEAIVTNVLLNHVIIGKSISASDIVANGSGYESTGATGPNDSNLSIFYRFDNNIVTLNGTSNVTDPDNTATNGVIHIVDEVIGLPTIATFATSNNALELLVTALDFADGGTPTVQPSYLDAVSDATAGPFTVFAPTDTAFGDVLSELDLSGFGEGMGQLNAATTDAVLLMHIVSGNVQSSGLPNGPVMTLGGEITANNTTFVLTDGLDREIGIITDPALFDIQAINGVVHVVDRVIRPAN